MSKKEKTSIEIDSAFYPERKPASPKKAGSGAGASPSARRASATPRKRAQRPDPHEEQRRQHERKAARRAPAKAAPKKRASARRRARTSPTAVILPLTGLLCLIALFVSVGIRYNRFLDMRRTVEKTSFYGGTVVDSVDISGMDLDQALSYWEKEVEPRHASRTVSVQGAKSVTSSQLGYSSNYASVLTSAFNAGRRGTLAQRYSAIRSREGGKVSYTVDRRYYDPSVIKSYVNALGEATDRDPQNATITGFNASKRTFTYSDGRSGARLDREKLANDIVSCLENGGGSVTPVIATTQPSVTRSNIEGRYGLICSAVTNASSSSSNRLNNIKLALASVNGTCLKPGETFSYNGTVGERTAARGYKEAAAYNSGDVIQEIGGGICQVSTTIFNAAVKADLKIVERHNHSIPVSYVDKGKDATVSWGVQDLRFKNTTDGNIYICCYLSDNKRVYVEIYGLVRDDGVTITVEPTLERTYDFETEYRENFFLASGVRNTVKDGRKGYDVTTYKVWHDKNGKTIKKEVLCTSEYPRQNRLIEVGTG